MTDCAIRGATVLGPEGWRAADLVVRDGVLVDEASGGDGLEVDATGLRAVPGLIDLQCNGWGTIDLQREPERLWELAALLPAVGVTAWLPTIVTSPPESIDRALGVLAAGPPPGWRGAVPVGLHLEGPFFGPSTRGAHPKSLLRLPTLDAVAGWSRDAGVAVVTLAPELPGALEVIEHLVAQGVVVSIGHSAASATQATAAVDAGARWVTHLHNGMVPLHHRDPGVIGVALSDERLHVGLIADGVHVDPLVVGIDQRVLGRRLTLVTDAVGAPMSDAGGARLADGTLAGTDLGLDQAVRNLVDFSGCSVEEALHAGAGAPAAVLQDPTRGSLRAGARADVVLLDDDLQVVATIVGGQLVHDTR